MISIDVQGAFGFLNTEAKIGTLHYERVKGDATYIFEYEPSFLEILPGTILSREIGVFMGKQSTRGSIFAFLSDACPDRWGKALIDKREARYAKKMNRSPRAFDDFGYLVRLDDRTRMGALRFLYEGEYIGTDFQNNNVPIIADLKDIIRESQAYEKAVMENREPEDLWINNLWNQGSSLGGARPKANISDNGILYIAKIPSVKDIYDVALWENFASKLAFKAGIEVPETKTVLLPTSEHHVLLSRRFDREGERRIHYASSLTLSGLRDGDGAGTNNGYLDIVNTIIGDANITEPQKNLEQLYRRVAFNIMVGNHDDHFRNHGFILTKKGWTLAPAFDLNPTNMMSQSLMISSTSNESSINELLKECESYCLERRTAEEIVERVRDAVASWRLTARETGISASEQTRFAKRLDYFSKGKIMKC